ncbi:MAG: TorF family putative porin [Pseudolabrys sp.]
MKKKYALSVVAALALFGAAPAFAADMPVKAEPAPAAVPSPFDIAFGTAFTSDYVLRGISQTMRNPAVQGYFEGDYKVTPWLTLYAGLWGSNVKFANSGATAELDLSGGGRFSWGNFGLDVGYVYYFYPGDSSIEYGEFYGKPSYKVTDWLTLNAQVIGGDNFGNAGITGVYYAGGPSISLPNFLPMGITSSISGNYGYQYVQGGGSYSTWDAGISFTYKAITLDLRYFDTNGQGNTTGGCALPSGTKTCDASFVATLKFDTTLSALK